MSEAKKPVKRGKIVISLIRAMLRIAKFFQFLTVLRIAKFFQFFDSQCPSELGIGKMDSCYVDAKYHFDSQATMSFLNDYSPSSRIFDLPISRGYGGLICIHQYINQASFCKQFSHDSLNHIGDGRD